jgi:hypothetical protein
MRSAVPASRPSSLAVRRPVVAGARPRATRAGNQGDASAGQRAISAARASCGNAQSPDNRTTAARIHLEALDAGIPQPRIAFGEGGRARAVQHPGRIRFWHSAAAAHRGGAQRPADVGSATLGGFGTRPASPGCRGRLSTTSNSNGSAVTAPYWPGSGVPSGRPTHTPTV